MVVLMDFSVKCNTQSMRYAYDAHVTSMCMLWWVGWQYSLYDLLYNIPFFCDVYDLHTYTRYKYLYTVRHCDYTLLLHWCTSS